jgi:hypothetical protein
MKAIPWSFCVALTAASLWPSLPFVASPNMQETLTSARDQLRTPHARLPWVHGDGDGDGELLSFSAVQCVQEPMLSPPPSPPSRPPRSVHCLVTLVVLSLIRFPSLVLTRSQIHHRASGDVHRHCSGPRRH